MSLIQWNDSYSVKVIEIDKQHKELVSMVNELNDAMRQGKGKDVLARILNGLISYTASHFKTEEKYFDKFRYPEASIHKKEHAAFVKQVSDFQIGFEREKLTITIELMTFLSDLITKHIKGTDKKYSEFFNAKGLK
jgi:hemerythrin